MNVPDLANSGSTWELIKLPVDVFVPRASPAVVALNESEIAIMGGWNYFDDELSDVIVFNFTQNKWQYFDNYVAYNLDYKF